MVHAPRGRDANVVQEVLAGRGISAQVCQSQNELLAGLVQGAAAAVVTEESFTVDPGGPLEAWLQQQPSWSDFPFIVLTTRQASRR